MRRVTSRRMRVTVSRVKGCSAKPALAREPENANGAFVAVPFVGDTAKRTTRTYRNGKDTGVKKAARKNVSPFLWYNGD